MNQQIPKAPLVSVIMPVYNAERYVGQAISSILGQSFTDFEFIIVNDGSIDNTSEILHSYNDSRINLIERENKGFAESLNEAILLSRGKYIVRMDADDIALENRLQTQYAYMEANKDVGILGGQAYLINERNERVGETNNPVGQEDLLRCMKFICPMTHPSYFVRREIYKRTRGYRHLPPVEDYDFLLRAVELGVVVNNLPDKVILYRLISTGMSLGNPQRGIVLKGLVQRMHKRRVAGKSDEKILAYIRKNRFETTSWFRFVYSMKNRLSIRKNRQKGISRYILYGAIVVVSLMHYQLFLFEYSYFKARMVMD